MNTKKIFSSLFGFIIAILLINGFIKILLYQNQVELENSEKLRYRSLSIAEELRQTSDDLTKYCRLYTMTRNTDWETKFWKVLNIRNGEVPRPNGRLISLRDSMQSLGFTSFEFELMARSENNSNELVNIEIQAFNAMKGVFLDSLGDYSVKSKPNVDLAQRLTHSEKYLQAKDKIMQPIDFFINHVDGRTSASVAYYRNKNFNIIILSLFLKLGGIIVSIIAYYMIRKRLIQQIQLEKSLRLSNIELRKQKLKAEKSDNLKTAFLINLSHEIRTPMNGILGFINLLRQVDLTDEEKNKYINLINSSGERLLSTITDIIEISKIESGDIQIEEQTVDIIDLLVSYYHFFESEIKEKRLHFCLVNIDNHKKLLISIDKRKLDLIISNLINNAIKFTEIGSIELGCELKDSMLLFFVKDTGIGINREHTDSIFEKFTQLDHSINRNYEGSGLGLPICKAYVEMMGGKIWVESKKNIGSSFYFTIPIDDNA